MKYLNFFLNLRGFSLKQRPKIQVSVNIEHQWNVNKTESDSEAYERIFQPEYKGQNSKLLKWVLL